MKKADKFSFPDGEIPPSAPSPIDAAAEYLEHRSNSVKEEIAGSVSLSKNIVRLKKDAAGRKAFLEILADAKVIRREEVNLQTSQRDSTLSKLTKLSERSDVILHPKILPYVRAGYTVLYELIRLYEALENVDDKND